MHKGLVRIPEITIFENIVSTRPGYKVNTDFNPKDRFGVYCEEKGSKILCVITPDTALFSIDIINAEDETLQEILKEILISYNLETNKLLEDICKCYARRTEIQTDYERYWVSYRYHRESGRVLVRYRAFI